MISASKVVEAAQVLVKRFASNETVRCVVIANRNAAAKDLTMWFVPKDTILGDEHQVLPAVEFYPNESVIIQLFDVKLEGGESIFAQGSAGSTFSVTVMVN